MTTQTESHTRLHGRWLFSARLAWIAIAILTTIMHIVALPVAFNLLRTPCYQEPCDTPFQTPSGMESAVQEEASLKGAWQSTIWEITAWLVPLGVALLIFWRRSDDWMAHLASIMLVTIPVISPWPEMLAATQPLWYWPRALLWAVGLASSVGLFYLFPDGRFVPRWTGGLAIALLVIIGALAVEGAPFLAAFPIFMVVLTTGTVFQIYRYRRVSDPLQRQQTKWVVLGIIGMVLPMLVVFFVAFLNPSWNPLLLRAPRSPQFGEVFGNMVTAGLIIPLCFLPVTLAFSMLRYRLWDVDILINRTLVYGALTASVVGLYVVIVGWLSISLQTNHLPANVFAILVIAFLFQPLHQQLQHIADRFVPTPRPAPPLEHNEYEITIPESQGTADTTLRGRWLLIARLTWVAAFTVLGIMYALGFVEVREALSTVCKEELCTLRQQIRHTAVGEQVMNWGGPPIGFADRLRPDQVEALESLGLTLDQYGWLAALQIGIPVLVYLLIAAGLFWWKSNDWLVLFVSTMVMMFPFVDTPLPYTLAVHRPAWEWVAPPAEFIAVLSWLIWPLIFPTGRFVPRWTRWKILFDIAFTLISTLNRYSTFRERPGAGELAYVYVVISFCINVYAQAYRYFRVASPVERQQIKWVVVGLAGFIGTGVMLVQWNGQLISQAGSMDSARAIILSTIPDTLFRAISLFIPVSIVISVLRYRLWDIDIIISRTLVYGALTVGIVALYVLLVGGLSIVSQTTGNLLVSLLATGLIAFLFQPVRERLQRGVNRMMYGERDDPYVVLSQLGQRLETALAPTMILSTIVETIGRTLKLPFVEICLSNDKAGFVSFGEPQSKSVAFPLAYQNESVGELHVAPRVGESLNSADHNLLKDLARQTGIAIHAARVTADLQRSRESLVLAREEERRRLRRDLHDDLAPTLASLGLTASTAADLISTNPTMATAMVKELQTEIRATVGNIRRLVYDLRPPALDELGLLAAVRERAAQYSNAPGGVHITVDAPAHLPALPAAVEVAAYRIVQEALENVSKHSQARTCSVRFANHDGLEIEITDDGIGLLPNIKPGVGLRSMRERSEELGGRCVIERCENGGTRILARLPIGGFDGTIAHPDRR